MANEYKGSEKYSGQRSTGDHAATGDGNDYTTKLDDEIVGADTSTSGLTVTLASAHEAGDKIVVNDEGGNANNNNITVATEGSENIDGSSTATISSADGSLRLYFNGSNWFSY